MQKKYANVHQCLILFVYLHTFISQFFINFLYEKPNIISIMLVFYGIAG